MFSQILPPQDNKSIVFAQAAKLTEEERVDLLYTLYNTLADKPKFKNYLLRQERKKRNVNKNLPAGESKSASCMPLLFNAHLIPTNSVLFLDVEKVSIKLQNTCLKSIGVGRTTDIEPDELQSRLDWLGATSTHRQVAATVAVVNLTGELVLSAVIKWPSHEICQYFTSITGLRKGDLEYGVELSTIHDCLKICCKSNTLVGQAIAGDLKSLAFHHWETEDLEDFFRDERSQPYSLRSLAKALLGLDNVQECVHSAITDARLTQKLYQKKLELQKLHANKRSRLYFDFARVPRTPFKRDRLDVCKCLR